MFQFMWRTMTFVFVLSALALFADAQTTSNTTGNANKSQAVNQANSNQPAAANAQTNPATPPTKGARVQPGANQRTANPSQAQAARTNRTQANPNVATQPNRLQANPNVVTQPNASTQRAPVNLPGQVRTGVVAPPVQNAPINSGVLESRSQERIAFRPQVLRGPDVGLWFNPNFRDRLVVSDVVSTGPFARLGFMEGDRIVSVNGRAVLAEPDFMQMLVADSANPAEVVVFRNGRNERIVVDPTILNTQANFVPEVQPLDQFGIVLDDRFNDRVVVWQVVPQSPAFYAGFRPGDVVTTLSGQPFRTRTDFENAVVGLRAGQADVQVRRGDRTRNLIVDVPQFARTAQRGVVQPRAGDRIEARGAVERSGNNQGRNQPQNNPAVPNARSGAGDRGVNR